MALDRIELLCGKRPTFYDVDITNETELDKIFAAHPRIDSVVHFAALKVTIAGSCESVEKLIPRVIRPSVNPLKYLSSTIVSMLEDQ